MTSPSGAEAARAVNLGLVRTGAIALGVTAVVVVVVSGLAQGWDGAWGALLGVVLVGLFFGVDLAVYLRPGWSTPSSSGVVVMLYVAKLLVFASLVVGLAAAVSFDHGTFLVAVVVEAFVAMAVAVRAFTRMRVPYVQP